MSLDEQAVKEITLQQYKNEVEMLLNGINNLEQLIILRADKSPIFQYKEGQENEKIAISICIIRIYKTLKVIYNSLITGYYTESISLLRNIVELQVMIRFFEKKPDKAILWMKNEFEPKYGNMCDELGYEIEGRKSHYKMLCEHTHPNFKGNLFFNWDIEKMKETNELNFVIEFTNSFNEFIFLGILQHLLLLVAEIQIKQFRTFNLTKDTREDFFMKMIIEPDNPFKEALDKMTAYQKESKELSEVLFKKMIEVAEEKGADMSDVK